MRVGLVTDRVRPELTPDDRLLLKPLRAASLQPEPVVWTDASVEWAAFDGLVIRSCWDYHERPEAFLQWLADREAEPVATFNPALLVRWNLDKRYLAELAANDVRIPQTLWIRRPVSDPATLMRRQGLERAVLKPVVGATAAGVSLVRAADGEGAARRLTEILADRPAMLQEFVGEIVSAGEWSLIFIDGDFSHAVLKRARPGEYRVQTEWGGTVEAAVPPTALVDDARAVLGCLPQTPLYARVDGAAGRDGLILLELELIEPELFFTTAPGSAERLAGALARRLGDSE